MYHPGRYLKLLQLYQDNLTYRKICVFQVNYDKAFIHARVPYTEIPYEVYNLENGGPRPTAHLDERYKLVQFKVTMIKDI